MIYHLLTNFGKLACISIQVFQPKKFRISSRQVGEFKKKLEAFLDRPFQVEELNDLEEHACLRKPLLRLRETRQRVLHVATNKEGLSYLDYHPGTILNLHHIFYTISSGCLNDTVNLRNSYILLHKCQ